MRALHQFSAAEWLTLRPLRDGLRQLRNDAVLSGYLRRRPAGLDAFLREQQAAGVGPVACVVAFEQPWAMQWLLTAARANLPGLRCMVFDNSRKPAARAAIAQVCRELGVAYLALPRYRSRHPNRSHGIAMSWVWHHVLRVLQPPVFGFLDHDLVPVAAVDVLARIDGQPAYGLLNPGRDGVWNLWAGYCFFRHEAMAGRALNFLYDFSRGVDTGGRNWKPVYSTLDRANLRFASREILRLHLPTSGAEREVECLDGSWVHIGGIGYGDNFERKYDYFEALRRELMERDWASLRAGATTLPCKQSR